MDIIAAAYNLGTYQLHRYLVEQAETNINLLKYKTAMKNQVLLTLGCMEMQLHVCKNQD